MVILTYTYWFSSHHNALLSSRKNRLFWGLDSGVWFGENGQFDNLENLNV